MSDWHWEPVETTCYPLAFTVRHVNACGDMKVQDNSEFVATWEEARSEADRRNKQTREVSR